MRETHKPGTFRGCLGQSMSSHSQGLRVLILSYLSNAESQRELIIHDMRQGSEVVRELGELSNY